MIREGHRHIKISKPNRYQNRVSTCPTQVSHARSIASQASRTQLTQTTATRNTPLPPSVEKAYHTKCKELKQRLIEIEEANDGARQRKQRIDRAILKMRLERAILLERLQKVQLKGAGVDVADSERSNSPPPAEVSTKSPLLSITSLQAEAEY